MVLLRDGDRDHEGDGGDGVLALAAAGDLLVAALNDLEKFSNSVEFPILLF